MGKGDITIKGARAQAGIVKEPGKYRRVVPLLPPSPKKACIEGRWVGCVQSKGRRAARQELYVGSWRQAGK